MPTVEASPAPHIPVRPAISVSHVNAVAQGKFMGQLFVGQLDGQQGLWQHRNVLLHVGCWVTNKHVRHVDEWVHDRVQRMVYWKSAWSGNSSCLSNCARRDLCGL
jgi:hypothetical protein